MITIEEAEKELGIEKNLLRVWLSRGIVPLPKEVPGKLFERRLYYEDLRELRIWNTLRKAGVNSKKAKELAGKLIGEEGYHMINLSTMTTEKVELDDFEGSAFLLIRV